MPILLESPLPHGKSIRSSSFINKIDFIALKKCEQAVTKWALWGKETFIDVITNQ